MKIALDNSKEEMLDALNNSIVALGDIATSFYLGCQVSPKWAEWQEKQNIGSDECYEILNKRVSVLKSIYGQIENIDD